MPSFAVNLSMLFTELPLAERFVAANKAGFNQVEIQFPYELSIEQIEQILSAQQQQLILINLPAGDWAGGERGIACLPDRMDEFDQGLEQALSYAKALKVKTINCLAGIQPKDITSELAASTFVRNLKKAAKACAEQGIQLVAEAINTQDIPSFFLHNSQQLFDLIEQYQIDNLKLQYDVYHMQIMEGNLIHTLRNQLDKIAHIQIADVPGRHEPGSGEINFPNLFKAIDEMGYKGRVSLEYVPATDTKTGLNKIAPLLA